MTRPSETEEAPVTSQSTGAGTDPAPGTAGTAGETLEPPLKVVYIGGLGRSGSTLIDRVLGALPGVVAVGELVHLIQRGLIENELCGCGEMLQSCEFWTPVLTRTFGEHGGVADARELRALQARVDRNRYVPRHVAPGIAPGRRGDLADYVDLLGRLYRSIADEAGARVVVDSSKHVSTAYLLNRVPTIDLRVVHLVRDPRGVSHSWTKSVSRPEAHSARTTMHRYPVSRSATRWLGYNASFEALDALTVAPTTRVIYEDFIADPAGQLERIVAQTDMPAEGPFNFIGDGWVELEPGHSVAGNPMRFSTGRIDLRVDHGWRQNMATADQRIVTGLTAPMLAAYGYLRR